MLKLIGGRILDAQGSPVGDAQVLISDQFKVLGGVTTDLTGEFAAGLPEAGSGVGKKYFFFRVTRNGQVATAQIFHGEVKVGMTVRLGAWTAAGPAQPFATSLQTPPPGYYPR